MMKHTHPKSVGKGFCYDCGRRLPTGSPYRGCERCRTQRTLRQRKVRLRKKLGLRELPDGTEEELEDVVMPEAKDEPWWDLAIWGALEREEVGTVRFMDLIELAMDYWGLEATDRMLDVLERRVEKRTRTRERKRRHGFRRDDRGAGHGEPLQSERLSGRRAG